VKPEEREAIGRHEDERGCCSSPSASCARCMFGEESIALNAEAAQERLVKVQEKRLIEEREAAKKRALEFPVRRRPARRRSR
jgi:hypothetical protein